MEKKSKKVVMAAMFVALTCIATMIIKIPSPFKGYLNLGDCMVLLSGWLLSPFYGFMAAGIGSAIADMISGYAIYAPITFIIKGVIALIANYLYRLTYKKVGDFPSRTISGIAAEIIMVFGYFVFEGFLYGFVASVVNVPINVLQGIAGLIIGLIAVKTIEKNKKFFNI